MIPPCKYRPGGGSGGGNCVLESLSVFVDWSGYWEE